MTMHQELLKKAEMSETIGLDTFIKVAHSYLGNEVNCIPPQTMRQAYQIYHSLPLTKRASRVMEYYEEIEPGRDKIAVKAIAANVVHDEQCKKANAITAALGKVTHTVGNAAKTFTTSVAVDTAMQVPRNVIESAHDPMVIPQDKDTENRGKNTWQQN